MSSRTQAQVAFDGVRVAWLAQTSPVEDMPVCSVTARSIDGIARVVHVEALPVRRTTRAARALPSMVMDRVVRSMDGVFLPRVGLQS